LEALAAIRSAIDAVPERWRWTAGATDRAVLLALVRIAERFGRLEVGASVRQVADEAGVGAGSASRALGRLHDFVRVVERGVGTRASTVRLERVEVSRRRDAPERQEVEPSGSVPSWTVEGSSLCRDVFWWGALGKRAGHAFELLGVEMIPTERVAGVAGRGDEQRRRHGKRARGRREYLERRRVERKDEGRRIVAAVLSEADAMLAPGARRGR